MYYIFNTFYRMLAYIPPSVMAAGALISGITCCYLQTMWILPLLCLAGSEILHYFQKLPRITAFFILISIACCGALRFSSQHTYYLELMHVLPKGLCSLQGKIVGEGTTQSNSYPYYIDVSTYCISSASYGKLKLKKPLIIRILLQTNNSNCEQGSFVECTSLVVFNKLRAHQTHYYARNHISCCGKTTRQSSIQLIQPPLSTIAHKFYTLKHDIIKAAQNIFSPATFALVAAIFFGYHVTYDKAQGSLREMFGWWGLNHLLARSGLHLTLFIISLGLLLSVIPLSLPWKHITIGTILVLYFLLSWSSVSFIRAACMAAWYIVCVNTFTAAHPLHIISCVSIAVLLYQPYYLFGLDFQLTFALTFALALIHHSTKIISNTSYFHETAAF